MTQNQKLEAALLVLRQKFPMAFSATGITGAIDEKGFQGYMLSRPSHENGGVDFVGTARLWDDGLFEVTAYDKADGDPEILAQNKTICEVFRQEFLKLKD